MTQTNLRKIKDIAIMLLETPLETQKNPFGEGEIMEKVLHPFLSDRIVCFPEDTEHPFQPYDILNDTTALQREIQRYKSRIEESKSIDAILWLVNENYRLKFLNLIERGLSSDEMGELLAYIWVDSENPNNSEIPLSTLVKWFKRANKQSLMDAEELAYYNSLPDEFTVYRGIGSESSKKGISYTLSLEKAEWFANRYQKNGYVLTGTAKKKDVLAYFNGREEQEVLIEPKNIADLHKMSLK